MIKRAPIRGWVLLAAVMLVLAACSRDAGDAPAILAPVEQGDGRLADCDGIETRLALVRESGKRSFVLTETYLAERPVRFVSSGRWEREVDLLELQADDGARLNYALLGDGSLQPRDGRGRRLAGNDADGLLVPVTSSPRR
jgi:uncharacterized lipoprotein NlpE involved in copper resistance